MTSPTRDESWLEVPNSITWAVAGARKTQQIVDACTEPASGRLRLAVTFTTTGQDELTRRLSAACPASERPDVLGWYGFLIRHWVKPYLPALYPSRVVTGFNFDGDPGFATGAARHFDADGRVYKRHLAKLAYDVNQASGGAPVRRLESIYSEIFIDEIQDLNGWDLEIVDLLLRSGIDIRMVGDPRQCVYMTNAADQKNRQFKGMRISRWFGESQRSARVTTDTSSISHRSISEVMTFADSIFPASFGFPRSSSAQLRMHEHMGIWAVSTENLDAYVEEFRPLLLTWDKRDRSRLGHASRNMGEVKGITTDHVLIVPTRPIRDFLASGTPLSETSACKLYVAATRAIFSVAFLTDSPLAGLECWQPAVTECR